MAEWMSGFRRAARITASLPVAAFPSHGVSPAVLVSVSATPPSIEPVTPTLRSVRGWTNKAHVIT